MQNIDLKQLLINYTNNLCDKQFVFILSKNKKLTVMFFRESLCHLMGLQHIFNNDTRYLGGKGYQKIKDELVTVDTLKKRNKKQYNFIKERLRHFDEIVNVLRYGKIISFNEEKVKNGTYIKADFVIYNNKENYVLHLFLRKEMNTDIYTPISYIVQTKNDIYSNKFLDNQRQIKIIDRKEISMI